MDLCKSGLDLHANHLCRMSHPDVARGSVRGVSSLDQACSIKSQLGRNLVNVVTIHCEGHPRVARQSDLPDWMSLPATDAFHPPWPNTSQPELPRGAQSILSKFPAFLWMSKEIVVNSQPAKYLTLRGIYRSTSSGVNGKFLNHSANESIRAWRIRLQTKLDRREQAEHLTENDVDCWTVCILEFVESVAM